MGRRYDAVSVGDFNVEFFHKRIDGSFRETGEIVGPYPSGAAAIFIDTMARLGASTGFVGTVGDDEFGYCIVDRLELDRVDTSQISRIASVATGIAFRACYSDGSRKFIYHIGNAAPGRLEAGHVDEGFIVKSRWLHVSGNVLAFGDSARGAVLKAVGIAGKAGIPISLDPNLRLEMMKREEIADILDPVLLKATLLLPSRGELRYITGIEDEDEGAQFLLDQGIGMIARKEGCEGCSIFTKASRLHINSFQVEEVDPTGCGDAFGAAFVFGILQGWGLKAVGEFANAVGAITATRYGPMEGISSLEEVMTFIQSHKQGG